MTNEELMQAYLSGDKSALSILCEQNQGFINSRATFIANDMKISNNYLEDLVSIGNIAFYRALTSGNYDESKGMVTTFAVQYIDGAMRKFLRKQIDISQNELNNIDGQQAIWDMEQNYSKHSHLHLPTPEGEFFANLKLDTLKTAFNKLTLKEREIIGYSYGVFGFEPIPQTELATLMLLTDDAFQKAKKKAISKLKNLFDDGDFGKYKKASAEITTALKNIDVGKINNFVSLNLICELVTLLPIYRLKFYEADNGTVYFKIEDNHILPADDIKYCLPVKTDKGYTILIINQEKN